MVRSIGGKCNFAVTIIEIRPFRNGWQVYEAPGVQPVFLSQEHAIDYAKARVCFALARFAFSIQLVRSHVPFRLVRRIENCNARCRLDFDMTFHSDPKSAV